MSNSFHLPSFCISILLFPSTLLPQSDPNDQKRTKTMNRAEMQSTTDYCRTTPPNKLRPAICYVKQILSPAIAPRQQCHLPNQHAFLHNRTLTPPCHSAAIWSVTVTHVVHFRNWKCMPCGYPLLWLWVPCCSEYRPRQVKATDWAAAAIMSPKTKM